MSTEMQYPDDMRAWDILIDAGTHSIRRTKRTKSWEETAVTEGRLIHTLGLPNQVLCVTNGKAVVKIPVKKIPSDEGWHPVFLKKREARLFAGKVTEAWCITEPREIIAKLGKEVVFR